MAASPTPANLPSLTPAARNYAAASVTDTQTTPPPANNQNTAQQKTTSSVSSSSTSTSYLPAVEKNILNNYRSWNYNFTMAALPKEVISNTTESLIADAISKYTVLDSAGKGTSGIQVSQSVATSGATTSSAVSNLIEGFNKNSPGRFDMYIDDVSIDSIIGAGSNQSGTAIATGIKFTVIEPYSMNGLVEAMQVAAQAAGWGDYKDATFCLRMQFNGYKDSDPVETAIPEIIPNSTRFFCITITGIEVEVTEQGTKYLCSAVPTNQLGFGTPNLQTSDIKVEGNYVWEVLQSYFKAINFMVQDDAKKSRGDQNAKCDTYEISCPILSTPDSPQDIMKAMLYSPRSNISFPTSGPNSYQSDIIKAKINDGLKEVNVFQTADPATTKSGYAGARPAGAAASPQSATPAKTTTPPASATNTSSAPAASATSASTIYVPSSGAPTTTPPTSALSNTDPATGKLVPTKGTVIFSAGKQIHDAIAALVRDSEYVRVDVLQKQLDAAKKGDKMVTYFTVRMEIDVGDYDPVGNKYFKNYRYILEPYRMVYTRIPGQEQGQDDLTAITKQIKREYNYIYTGLNVDILKFQLKFDNLYFTAVPPKLGNRAESVSVTGSAAPSNKVNATQGNSNAPVANSSPSTIQSKQSNSTAAPSASSTSQPASTTPGISTPATQIDPNSNNLPITASGQQQADPYYKLAQTMHDAVLSTHGTGMITANMEILGDPYFLVTGGMGNQNLQLTSQYLTTDGQAPTTQGEVYLNINFRNPIDMHSTGVDDGFAQFDDKNRLPFSGIYRITNLVNNFKGGVFTQEVDVIRVDGQVLGKQTPAPASDLTTTASADPGTQVTQDSKPSTIPSIGITPDSINLGNLLNRGFPSQGLPGVPSNFTNGLSSLASAVNQSANNLLSQVSGALGSVTGSPLSSINGLLSQVSGVTGQVSAIANQLGANPLGSNPLGGVNPLTQGVSISPSALGAVLSTPNLSAAAISAAGSAIGNIANISNAAVGLANNVVDSIASQVPVGTAVPASITDLTQSVSGLAGSNVSSLIGGVGNAINNLQNAVPTDISGISSQLGIDPSVLSGLDPLLSSNLTSQLESVAALVPVNTNITGLEDSGVVFKNISGYQLPNLPALQPSIPAPDALIDPALDSLTTNFGNVSSVIGDATNLPALTDLTSITNPLGNVTSGVAGALGSAQSVVGQISNIQGQVNSVVGNALGVSNAVGSLSQNAISGLSSAAAGLGSVESAISNVSSIAQVGTSNLAASANAILGSKQTLSPLTKLIQNSNIQGSI